MQTICRYFYGTKWSPAANSGQQGPWSYEHWGSVKCWQPVALLPNCVLFLGCTSQVTPGAQIHWSLVVLNTTEIFQMYLFSRCHSNNIFRCLRTWWRHQMEAFSALLAIFAGNSPVPGDSPHKGQWRGALMFSLICVWINGGVNNREAGNLRRYRAHYDVTVMEAVRYSVHFY